MEFNLIEIISITAVIQSLLLAVYFITLKSGNKPGNILLSSLLTVFILLIVSSLFLTRGANIHFLKIIILCNQSALIIGPLIFLYVSSFFMKDFKFKKQDLVHFIPFVLVTGILFFKFYIRNDFITWRSAVRIFGSGVFLLQSLVYLFLCIKKYRFYRINHRDVKDAVHEPAFHWFRFILIGFIGIWLINMHTFIILDLWKRHGWCPYMYSIYFLVLFIFVNTMIFIILKLPKLFSTEQKYKNSSLSEIEKHQYRSTLLSYMEEKKPYLDPLITLAGLSKQVRITMCYLSQVINESFNQNFRDFINQYRIEESKQLLINQSNKKENILNVAYRVGFNSKSAFNKAFRKFTGMTPKEYRHRHFEKFRI